MAKTLVLAEKPSVGREIARVLGCKNSAGGYISGSRYIVTWAMGHLVTLADPEKYGDRYKTWSMDTLPMMPEKMELVVIPGTAKQYSVVKKLLHSSEVDSLVIATDAGREGELVARWILTKAGFSKPIQRLWISSQTDKAINQGFASLKDGKEYMSLYHAAQSRAEADWLVGLNVTRALTCKHNAQLSAGRVQTPTLAIMVQREEEIKKFIPKDYYTVQADLGSFFATYRDDKNQTAIYDRSKAEQIEQKVKNQQFKITNIQVSPKSTPPPLLYDLTELQRDANKIYSYSAKETLSIMQRLYENHKVLTYPRTDSRYLTDDIVPTLPERLRAVAFGEFASYVGEINRQRRAITKVCVNNNKVSDHHAIIPTEQRPDFVSMNTDEKRIYLLVVKRFLTCFYPSYEYRQMKIELSADGETFFASGREVTNQGWKKVTEEREEEEENEQTLPSFHKGDTFLCKGVQIKAAKTTPPARYTEASLLSAMENPTKFIEDRKMREYIGGGLGTPATRADIIEKLFSSFYVEKRGTTLIPTSKGMQLIELVPPELKEPELTAKWEQQLDAISKRKADKSAFMKEIKLYTKELVKTVADSQEQYKHDNMTRDVCPQCNKFLLSVHGKRGQMLVCQDRECGYRQNVSIKTTTRCPNCHKQMELFGEGEKKTYICPCGFREKADSFHKDKDSANSASKQYVKQYMQKQKQQDKEEESPFAAMLKQALEDKK